MILSKRLNSWPWLTLQIIAANVAIVVVLAAIWYLAFSRQSAVYSELLMSTFNIRPGALHAMYVDNVERHLWISAVVGLVVAILASVGLAVLIARPLRALAKATERLRNGEFSVRSEIETGEVGHLARNFNALAESLEQEERRRAQYMADLSHELRTPVTNLRGYVEGLEDGVFQADKSYFELLSGEMSHMITLINTIESMQIDAIETSCRGKLEEGTVADVVQSGKSRWKTRMSKRAMRLDLQYCDDVKERRFAVPGSVLKQIFDNLLSNMIRYASPSEPCRILVSKGEKSDVAKLEFTNLTHEVNSESLPFLFDRFYRVSTSRTRIDGQRPNGLGMSIVRQLCLAAKGNVSASLQDELLTIEVSLPLQK